MTTVREILTTAAAVNVGLTVRPDGIAWARQGPLPDDLRAAIRDHKPAVVAALSRGPCRNLGPAVNTKRMLALGVNPAACGCGGKIRECDYHGDVCTTVVPKDGLRCCAVCDDHEEGKS